MVVACWLITFGELDVHASWVCMATLYGKLLCGEWNAIQLSENPLVQGFICPKVHFDNRHKQNPDHNRPTSLGWVIAVTNPRGAEVLHCLYCLACDDCGFPGERTLGQTQFCLLKLNQLTNLDLGVTIDCWPWKQTLLTSVISSSECFTKSQRRQLTLLLSHFNYSRLFVSF